MNINAGDTTEINVGVYNFEIVLADLAQSTVYEIRISIETPEKLDMKKELESLLDGSGETQSSDNKTKPQEAV